MSDKREYKVISSVTDRNGKHLYWARIGTGWANRDNSVNIHMDVIPKSFQIQLREMTPEDYRRREEAKVARGAQGGRSGMGTFDPPMPALPPQDHTPF